MDAKKLLKKHIELKTPKGIYLSDRQLAQIQYEATINAINEALTYSVVDPDITNNTLPIVKE